MIKSCFGDQRLALHDYTKFPIRKLQYSYPPTIQTLMLKGTLYKPTFSYTVCEICVHYSYSVYFYVSRIHFLCRIVDHRQNKTYYYFN